MHAAKSPNGNKSLPWSSTEIRSAFLKFYADKGHKVLPSASLIPDDPTVLLTIAGMLPFKPVFLGKEDKPANRATSSQKCIRTNDIDNVGRTARHHTFFEMLGNFSFGDYFKKEAILWAWELTTEVFKIDPKNLIVSIFREDDEAETLWRDGVGLPTERIIRMDEADNFWASGPTGPCGPCSEIYYDFNPELGIKNINLEDDKRFIEFYNLVFMQYNRDSKGNLTPLDNCNIDTGLGLERMAQILQSVPNNYETDLIYPLIEYAASIANIDYKLANDQIKTSLKIIGDHCRAVVHLIADGVSASNLGRGYILRRLIRRLIRHGRIIGISKPFLKLLGKESIDLMRDSFPNLLNKTDLIINELSAEESRFLITLERGEKLLESIISAKPKIILGVQAFELYDTYGFPLELTQEIAEENDLLVDIEGFDKEMVKQRLRAQSAAVKVDLTLQDTIEKVSSEFEETEFQGYEYLSCQSQIKAICVNGKLVNKAAGGDKVQIILDKTPFFGESGGQIGDQGILINDEVNVRIETVTRQRNVFIHSGEVQSGFLKSNSIVNAEVDIFSRRKAQSNHTATHLLQSALKLVVDSKVGQRGSLVAFDRLRFDFNSPRPLKLKELIDIEKMINNWIAESHPIIVQTMSLKQALEDGALAMFGEKYGDIVRVVDVPGVSMELCGGTHVINTAELSLFKLINESGIASGIRRIEAVAGPAALAYLNERDEVVKELSEHLKVQPLEIVERVSSLQNEVKSLSKTLLKTREDLALARALSFCSNPISIGSHKIIVERLDGIQGDAMQIAVKVLLKELGDDSVVFLGGVPNTNDQKKVVFVAAFGDKVISSDLHAGKFVGDIAKLCDGGGGGRPNLAQAGGKNASYLDKALKIAREKLISNLD